MNVEKILLCAAEAMPFAATGGLGDVMGSLPAALYEASGKQADVRVVLPFYDAVSETWRSQMKLEAEFEVQLAWRSLYCGVWSLQKDGVTYYFLDNAYYFRRQTLYGAFDDGERFAFYCRAVVEVMHRMQFYPDVLHANDWQAALTIIYTKCKFGNDPRFQQMKTVFTIHNVEYQGQYDFAIYEDVLDLHGVNPSLLEMDGCINLMKGAICVADCVSTVSEKYAQELCDPGISKRLCPILQANSYKMRGILNGIDYVYYDPQHDPGLAENYTWRSVDRKLKNKLALQQELSLPQNADIPMIAVISRLASHKGLDLITEQATRMMYEQNAQLVILGCGEPQYEQFFANLQGQFPDKVRACLCYDRDLSRRIYAACDIFLMPSRSEPCGLSQMIASRYGAIPVVRETGGLADSIHPYWEEDGVMHGNGFTFYEYSGNVLYDRVCAALWLWNDTDRRKKYIAQIMRTDFSWNASAKRYLEMYQSL